MTVFIEECFVEHGIHLQPNNDAQARPLRSGCLLFLPGPYLRRKFPVLVV